jgi:Rha family phage regulatory protein
MNPITQETTMQLALNLPNPLAARESLFIDHEQPFTTSRAVAERFGKNHDKVVRDIKKLISDINNPQFSLANFGESTYTNSRGKTYPAYRLTHDGFALLAMGFTGRDALAWKVSFIQAFNALEAELKARVEREANALYTLRPHWRAIASGLAAGLKRAQICQITGHRSTDTISANTRRMREIGLLATAERKAA